MRSMYSWIGHRSRELLLYANRAVTPTASDRRVLFFPGEWARGSASDLRATAIARNLRRIGWRAIVVPPQLELQQRLRIIRAEKAELIVLHQSRHPLNRPRYYPRISCIYDADDADILDPKCRDDVIECCRDSVEVIAGSQFLADQFRPYNSRVRVIWTGTYLEPSGKMVPNEYRHPSVAWATSNPVGYSHEAEFVRKVILSLAKKEKFIFALYGVRPELRAAVQAYLLPIRDAGVSVRVFKQMSYKSFGKSLESVAVGLQPISPESSFSRGKSFGKLLAYMAADVAVVASHAVDHPLFFRHRVNGLLLANDVDRWADGISTLLRNAHERARLVASARVDFQTQLSTTVAAGHVDKVLNEVNMRLRCGAGY